METLSKQKRRLQKLEGVLSSLIDHHCINSHASVVPLVKCPNFQNIDCDGFFIISDDVEETLCPSCRSGPEGLQSDTLDRFISYEARVKEAENILSRLIEQHQISSYASVIPLFRCVNSEKCFQCDGFFLNDDDESGEESLCHFCRPQTCYNCEEHVDRSNPDYTYMFVKDYPDSRERVAYFCNEECRRAIIDAKEFGFRFCDLCESWICSQNTMNGFESHFITNVCTVCYKNVLLTKGQSRDTAMRAHACGEFISIRELKDAGYTLVPDSNGNTLISSPDTISQFNQRVLSFFSSQRDGDVGNLVIVTSSPGVFPNERYASIWIKPCQPSQSGRESPLKKLKSN